MLKYPTPNISSVQAIKLMHSPIGFPQTFTRVAIHKQEEDGLDEMRERICGSSVSLQPHLWTGKLLSWLSQHVNFEIP